MNLPHGWTGLVRLVMREARVFEGKTEGRKRRLTPRSRLLQRNFKGQASENFRVGSELGVVQNEIKRHVQPARDVALEFGFEVSWVQGF
jgi:hypothetical protein